MIRKLDAPRLPDELRTGKKKILEADVEKAVCDYATDQGWYHRKFSSPNRRSVPDQIMISPFGLLIFVEFKKPKETPTPPQVREATRLQEKGQIVFCCDDIGKGKLLVNWFTAPNAMEIACPFPQMPEVI